MTEEKKDELVIRLRDEGFTMSLSQARRLIAQGGVFVDGDRITEMGHKLSEGKHVIRVGKTKTKEVVVE